jgi:hypothetical protein
VRYSAGDLRRCGFHVVVIRDASRVSDVGSSLEAPRHACANLSIRWTRAEAIE